MRIAFRASGRLDGDSKRTGRGEYELAGKQGLTVASDIIGCDLDFQLSPSILIAGHCTLKRINGKPRIRLHNEREDIHSSRLLSALLLLRSPIRSRLICAFTADAIDFSQPYQVASVWVDILEKESQYCLLRPTALEIRQGSISQHLSIPERLGRIQAILTQLSALPENICRTLENYSAALKVDIPHKDMEHLRDDVYTAINTYSSDLPETTDALESLEKILGKHPQNKTKPAFIDIHENGENDQRSEIQIRSDYVRAWRQVAERGYQGRKFSKSVIDAYDSRCVISGYRLPKTELNAVPGVDAAHILPWAKYDLDTVNNGLCLSKTYHWAFDSGILQVIFDRDSQCYKVIMDNLTEASLLKNGCDVELFKLHLGKVDKSRLPKDKSLWPSPDFLDEFNKTIKPQSEAAIPAF